MNERKELIARLRLDYTASKLALSLMQQAADMLEADISRQVEVSESTRRIRKSALGTSTCRTQLRAELIERLRDATEGPRMLINEAADMLEADAQAVPQEPVAYLAWRDGKPCWEGDDCVCQDAVYPVDHDDDRTSMPVYLSPQPQRPLLTEDEIFEALDADTDDIATAKNDQESWGVILTMARAIEKKVRGEE